jgi:hypothetical protein
VRREELLKQLVMANRKSVYYRVIADFPEAKELVQHIICRLKVRTSG